LDVDVCADAEATLEADVTARGGRAFSLEGEVLRQSGRVDELSPEQTQFATSNRRLLAGGPGDRVLDDVLAAAARVKRHDTVRDFKVAPVDVHLVAPVSHQAVPQRSVGKFPPRVVHQQAFDVHHRVLVACTATTNTPTAAHARHRPARRLYREISLILDCVNYYSHSIHSIHVVRCFSLRQ